MRSKPSRCASANTGWDWPWVSACTVVGFTPEEFFSRPSMMKTASHTPHGMKCVNSAT